MKMGKEIVSSENIKPSSPTPPHLTTHNLSLLDQIVPPIFLPLILYFPSPQNPPKNVDEFVYQTTQNLKRSLSAILPHFHPLAGRIKDSLSIDCNDEGALFVVSKIKTNLSDFLKNPNKVQSHALIPCELTWTEPAPGTHVLMIQVSYFDCGGIAIGSLFYHKVTDGVTISTFLEAWAASARGLAETELPCYVAGSLFPHNKKMESESYLFSIMKQYFKIGKTVMRRYVFDSRAISTIRAKLMISPGGLEFRPSRVEVVSALIWKCFMVALSTSLNRSSKPKSLVNHAVNIRRKADPSFHEHSFGNFVWLAPASSVNKTDVDMKDLVGTMRNAINKIDSGFVKRMQDDEGFSGYQRNVEETWKEFHDDAEYLGISSWCNFGLYNVVDFGWGKPVWITGCNAQSDTEYPFLNMVWLMDTREGDGVEAWVYLDEQYFAAFDENQELQDLASVDPSPLDVAFVDPSPLDVAESFKKSVLINGHP